MPPRMAKPLFHHRIAHDWPGNPASMDWSPLPPCSVAVNKTLLLSSAPPPTFHQLKRWSLTQGSEMKNRDSSHYQRIWRWHFYAGLFVAPFLILLSLTGILYLYKPQLDNLLYSDLI